MITTEIREELFARAKALGFCSVGVADVAPFAHERALALAAIDDGRFSGMPWYTAERVENAADLRRRYPWGQSLLALAYPYAPAGGGTDAGRGGRIAAYACLRNESGEITDYHSLLKERCQTLMQWLQQQAPDVRHKNFIDHGWALDRAIAERAGLGFSGKHSGLITKEAGSYVFLAAILLSIPLSPTPPTQRNCGHCTACMPACPTNAILSPGVVDANRCISYLTIEHRGPIPPPLRPLMGTWIFGCDLCQEACPINHRLAPEPLPPEVAYADLLECLQMSEAAFAERFRHNAIWRAGRVGLARNAAIALGNAGDAAAVPALRQAAEHDPDPTVREAAVWAVEQLAATSKAADYI